MDGEVPTKALLYLALYRGGVVLQVAAQRGAVAQPVLDGQEHLRGLLSARPVGEVLGPRETVDG